MGYYLKALIGKSQPLQRWRKISASEHRVSLAQELTMIVVTEDFFDALVDKYPCDGTPPYDGFSLLTESVSQWAKQISNLTPVAYVEAEFFGGTGEQHAIVWDKEVVKLGPLAGEIGPINQALGFLGAQAISAADEFEAVGLRRGRDNEDWIKISDNWNILK